MWIATAAVAAGWEARQVNASSERTRPAIWGPVLIAAVFLAIIGGSAGWVIGARANAADREAADGGQQQFDNDRTDPIGGDAAPTGDTGGGDREAGADPYGHPSPDRCPAVTVKLAGGGALSRVLYIHTGASEVWICEDAHHNLFYQGHRGSPGEALNEGVNALFLTDVEKRDDWYLAVNSSGGTTTRYRISPDELVIEHSDGTEERQKVVDSQV